MDPVLEAFLSDPAADVSALHDVARIKGILEQCGREGRAQLPRERSDLLPRCGGGWGGVGGGKGEER